MGIRPNTSSTENPPQASKLDDWEVISLSLGVILD